MPLRLRRLVGWTLVLSWACGLHPELAMAQVAGTCDPAEVAITTTPIPPQVVAGMRRYTEIAANLPAAADLVAIGDSMVQFWSPRSLGALLPGKSAFNFGVGGDKVQSILWRLQTPGLEALHPSAVLLLFGTNNLGAGNSPCAITAGYEKVVEKVHSLWAGAKVYIFTIPRRGKDFDFREADRLATNTYLARIPGATIISTDFLSVCPERDGCGNYAKDFVHLSSQGYAKLDVAFRSAAGGAN